MGNLVFVRVAALEQTQRCHGAEDPGQQGNFRDVGLAEEEGLVRREAAGEKVEGHVARVAAQGCRIMQRSESVEIGDEVKRFPLILQFDGRTHHAKIIAQMQCAGGLDAGKDTFHERTED